MYDYDEELPAGFQEADLLQDLYLREGAQLDRLRAAGWCTHQSGVGLPADGTIYYPEQQGLQPGETRCTDGCGTVFPPEVEWPSREAPVRIVKEA